MKNIQSFEQFANIDEASVQVAGKSKPSGAIK